MFPILREMIKLQQITEIEKRSDSPLEMYANISDNRAMTENNLLSKDSNLIFTKPRIEVFKLNHSNMANLEEIYGVIDNELTLYFCYVDEFHHQLFSAPVQANVWTLTSEIRINNLEVKSDILDLNNYFSQFNIPFEVTINHLFKNYGKLISDSGQTDAGEKFWRSKILPYAFKNNIYVYLFKNNTVNRLITINDIEEYNAWNGDPATRLLISKNEIV